MTTSARRRRNLDMGRLREAMRGPGADTRVWLAAARVDEADDALFWDPQIGWIVDVTFYGGPLDQENAIPCKLGTAFAQNGATIAIPPGRGCEVVVAITDGDANSNPVIVGRVHNAGGCEVPLLVNTFPITELLAVANHILVTPHGVLEQIDGDRSVHAANQELVAGTLAAIRGSAISLGGTAATALTPAIEPIQPAVLGTLLQTATTTLVTALNAYALALGPPGPVVPVTTATTAPAATALATALTAYTTAITAALSAKVKLD